MTALYAIGDIHGQLAGLIQAVEWIEKDGGRSPLKTAADAADTYEAKAHELGVTSSVQSKSWDSVSLLHRLQHSSCRYFSNGGSGVVRPQG